VVVTTFISSVNQVVLVQLHLVHQVISENSRWDTIVILNLVTVSQTIKLLRNVPKKLEPSSPRELAPTHKDCLNMIQVMEIATVVKTIPRSPLATTMTYTQSTDPVLQLEVLSFQSNKAPVVEVV
jgi:hypothetical protein